MSYKNCHIKIIYKGHIKVVLKFMITSATWYCRVFMSSKCAEITKNSCHMVAMLISQVALMLIDFFFISDSSDSSSNKKSKRESSFPSNQDPKRIRLGGTSLNYFKLFSSCSF